MIYPIVGLMVGIFLGMFFPISIPVTYSKFLGVALLAGLDTVFGGLRAALTHEFNLPVFVAGFFSNTLLAAILVYLGDRLSIDLYYVALLTFGMRIFDNTGAIRRIWFEKRKKR